MTRNCRKCHVNKPLKEFGNHKNRPLGKAYICLACSRKQTIEFRKNNKEHCAKIRRGQRARFVEWVRAFKLELIMRGGGKCKRCELRPGKEVPVECFDFHHRDRTQKKNEISVMLEEHMCPKKHREEIIKEAAKCDVLCATCHRIEEYKKKEDRVAKDLIKVPSKRRGRCKI